MVFVNDNSIRSLYKVCITSSIGLSKACLKERIESTSSCVKGLHLGEHVCRKIGISYPLLFL